MALAVGVELADFVEEERSGALAILFRVAIFKSAQLSLERLLRKSSTAQFHKRQLSLFCESVDLPGNNLFSRAAFSHHQDRNVSWSNLRNQPLNRLDLRTYSGDVGAISRRGVIFDFKAVRYIGMIHEHRQSCEPDSAYHTS